MDKFLIKKPIVTEKSTDLGALNKYVFLVDEKITKSEAKKVLEKIYNVQILRTNVINVKGKTRRLGNNVGIKPGYKKIIATLAKGQKLDILPQ
ncbi:MAG: 50S ribosomal protein L23 [bacterium]|nr:50S ribosomal protein L23 [bacterium]